MRSALRMRLLCFRSGWIWDSGGNFGGGDCGAREGGGARVRCGAVALVGGSPGGRIVELARSPKLRGELRLVVDAAGVAMPVVDMRRAAQPGCGIAAVWTTGGQGEWFDGKAWHVPKLGLLARLQTLLESKRRRIGGTDARGGDAGEGAARYQAGETGWRTIERARRAWGNTRICARGGAGGLGRKEARGGASREKADGKMSAHGG
jgi:hypothetical protein